MKPTDGYGFRLMLSLPLMKNKSQNMAEFVAYATASGKSSR